MILPFNPSDRIIRVPVRLVGPKQQTIIPMALDTGATTSAISEKVAQFLGYDLDSFETDVELTTLNGISSIRRFVAQKLELQEYMLQEFPMLCYATTRVV